MGLVDYSDDSGSDMSDVDEGQGDQKQDKDEGEGLPSSGIMERVVRCRRYRLMRSIAQREREMRKSHTILCIYLSQGRRGLSQRHIKKK